MKIDLCLKKFKYHDINCKPLFYVYNIWWYNYYFYGYNWNNILNNVWIYIKEQNLFFLKKLWKTNNFYEVLDNIEEDRLKMLYDSVYYDRKELVKEAKKIYEESEGKRTMILLEWYWNGIEQSAYGVYYNFVKDKIWYRYDDMDIKEEEKIEWEITSKEFNLLMQIYFWVYDDEKIKKELEEKEKKWEYEEIKKYINREDMSKIFKKEIELTEEERNKMEDYLKLQLIRKPTEWAFPELNIRKIYDKNWDEEEQRKVVEKINKELGEEVVVLE